MSDDITRHYHGGNEFSRAANERTRTRKDDNIERIKEFVLGAKEGRTCYEAEVELGMLHQTCSARFTDLKTEEHGCFLKPLMGEDGKQTARPTDTGSLAGVWFHPTAAATPSNRRKNEMKITGTVSETPKGFYKIDLDVDLDLEAIFAALERIVEPKAPPKRRTAKGEPPPEPDVKIDPAVAAQDAADEAGEAAERARRSDDGRRPASR